MSTNARQDNLFAAEDFVSVYKSFKNVDFTSYDFDTIRSSLIEYIKIHYPEDFNDYIESSEFIAIIELLSYLGTSLAFRSDLNARENLLDTAERRESIIRLAKMINYQPKRNIAATGLLKIDSVRTNEPVIDSNGNSLKDAPIYWNDANNTSWFDQFVSVVDSAFNETNPFGKPSASETIGSIPTDLYNLNSVTGRQVAYNLSVSINGDTVPIDIVNPELSDTIDEKHPDPANVFSLIYRNDSLGAGSVNNGFFVKFVQGKMDKIDQRFDFPEPNRIWPIAKEDINNSDVYVQEIDQEGKVAEKWVKVPAVTGSNVIYNSLNFEERNVYEVIGGLNDTIEVKFPDGTFGDVPTGLYRTWYRSSLGRKVVFRPEDVSNLKITLPYYGKDNQQYKLTVSFSLKYTVSNGAAAESNEQIKTRAPQVYYTQDRMVNSKDYNVFPLTYGNEIVKARAVNRTHAGHSRYSTGTSDTTGFHDGITIVSDDGALYNDTELQREIFELTSDVGSNLSFQATQRLEIFISNNRQFENYFYNVYLPAFTAAENISTTLQNQSTYSYGTWKTSPFVVKSTTGFFIESTDATIANWPYGPINNNNVIKIGNQYEANWPGYKHVAAGASVTFVDPKNSENTITSSIKSVTSGQGGVPYSPLITNIGPIEFGSAIPDGWQAYSVVPLFRTRFYDYEKENIMSKMTEKSEFMITYNASLDEWYVIENAPVGNDEDEYDYNNNSKKWLIKVNYVPSDGLSNAYYEFTTRGISTVFESVNSVRFYWNPDDIVRDSMTGLPKYDTIEIMPGINVDVNGDQLVKGIKWDITGVFTQNDGHVETSKVKISPADFNYDGNPDIPDSFGKIVGSNDDVLFRKFKDSEGYVKTQPWRTKWAPDSNTDWPSSPLFYNEANNRYDIHDSFLEFKPAENKLVYQGDVELFQLNSPRIIEVPSIQTIEDAIANGGYGAILNATDRDFFHELENNPNSVTFKAWRDDFIGYDVYYKVSLKTDGTNGVEVTKDTRDWVQEIINGTSKANIITKYHRYIIPDIEDGNIAYKYGQDLVAVHSIYDYSLFIVPNKSVIVDFANQLTEIMQTSNDPNDSILVENYVSTLNNGKVFKVGIPGTDLYKRSDFYTLEMSTNSSGDLEVIVVDSDDYYCLNGISSALNINDSDPTNRDKMYFRWDHYVDSQQRIDPSPTNIIDLVVLTESYYNDMRVWKTTKGSALTKPKAPTSEDLRIQFAELNNYKSMSDELAFSSGKFKILFGDQAEDELKASFKVVKMASSKMSDSELKSNVIKAVDEYFSINNWNFGESFYFTELAAYIHSTLSRHLSSVVIVPEKDESEFGNLFEISCRPDELFMSTATVSNVEIISNLTNTNLRM